MVPVWLTQVVKFMILVRFAHQMASSGSKGTKQSSLLNFVKVGDTKRRRMAEAAGGDTDKPEVKTLFFFFFFLPFFFSQSAGN